MPENKSSFLQSEKNLFLRLKKYKDRQAFLAAYDLYIDQIYRFIYFKVNSPAEAEDLTSQVFIKGWSFVQDGKLKDDNEYRSLKSLLYKIARNTVIDYYRQHRAETSLEELADNSDLSDLSNDEQSLTERIDQQIDLDLVQAKLRQLKSEYRGLIVLRYLNQLSIAEIADIFKKSKANIRVTLFRALTALRELINKEEEDKQA